MKIESFQRWILVAGIVIVLNLFYAYLINAFYPEPLYEDYCKREQVTIIPDTQEECVAEEGAWTEGPNQKIMRSLPHTDALTEETFTGYCDISFTCANDYEVVRLVYNKNVFIARVALGMLVLVVGFFVSSVEPVALGLSLGGVISLIVGTVAYWSNMNDYLRVVVFGLALVILIWLGVKRFGSAAK